MFGLFKLREIRAADIDVGALFAQFFAFGVSVYNWQVSPAVLASTLATPDSLGALLAESRCLARVPLLVAYKRCIVNGVLTVDVERPRFPEGVPERVATAAVDLWASRCDPDRERELLLRIIVDWELIILDDDRTVVPADGFEPVTAGPDWNRTVVGYKVGKASTVRRSVFYLGDRRDGNARAVPWTGEALPFASAIYNIRIAAASAGRSGVIAAAPDRDNAAGTEPITSAGVGSVPYPRTNEKIGRIAAGPDEQARAYEA